MRTFLSIDLDFWNQHQKIQHVRAFLQKAKDSCDNVIIVDSHENLRKHVGKNGCDHLINVDFHSDIWDRHNPKNKLWDKREYSCGSWVNFVSPKNRLLYTWIHPHGNTPNRGYCCHGANPLTEEGRKHSGWKMTEMIASKKPECHIRWEQVTTIGVAFSYDWLEFKDDWGFKVQAVAEKIFGKIPKADGRKARLG